MTGHSMLPMLKGETDRVHDEDQAFGMELFGRRSIRKGDWKAVYIPRHDRRTAPIPVVKLDQWQLYQLVNDPAEMNDLAEQEPEKLAELIAAFDEYVANNNVILSPDSEPY